MNIITRIWLQSSSIFNPIQKLFNHSFWTIFEKKFSKYATNKSVLDLACGTGELINHISPQKYLGLDINNNYINYASNNHTQPKQSFRLQNITTHLLPDGYQTAFFISAAHHLSNKDFKKLIKNIERSDIQTLIIIDGYPKKYLNFPLKPLDSFLAGGKYFRSLNQIKNLVDGNLLMIDSGVFTSKLSAYYYPYIIYKTVSQKNKTRLSI